MWHSDYLFGISALFLPIVNPSLFWLFIPIVFLSEAIVFRVFKIGRPYLKRGVWIANLVSYVLIWLTSSQFLYMAPP